MKSIWKVSRLMAAEGVAALMFAPRAEATSIVVTPHFQTAVQGSTTVTVDIDVTGVSAIQPALFIGGASFDFDFDSTILQGTNAVLDPDGQIAQGMGIIGSGSFGAAGTSPFEAFFISAQDPALFTTQPDSFRLAELTFTALAPGLTNLTVVPIGVGQPLSDQFGIDITPGIVNGCLLVTAPAIASDAAADPCPNAAAVPEPATFGLLATGLAALVRRRKKSQK